MPLNETVHTPPDNRPWLCPQDGCPAPAHDTNGGYARGCQSGKASLERRRYLKLRTRGMQDRRRPAFPTRRRLRALSASGWSWPLMSERCGLCWEGLSVIASGRRAQVMTTTAVAVERLYAQLSHVPGPCVESRTWGAKRGWIPCQEWLDDELDDPTADPRGGESGADEDVGMDLVKVDRATSFRLPLSQLNPAEQDAAVTALWGRYTAAESAERLQTSGRQVERVRARIRMQERREADRTTKGEAA